jgi:hypothetical protein
MNQVQVVLDGDERLGSSERSGTSVGRLIEDARATLGTTGKVARLGSHFV